MAGRELAARLARKAMGVPAVVQAGHPVLRQKAADVSVQELLGPNIQNVISNMVLCRCMRALVCVRVCVDRAHVLRCSRAARVQSWRHGQRTLPASALNRECLTHRHRRSYDSRQFLNLALLFSRY